MTTKHKLLMALCLVGYILVSTLEYQELTNPPQPTQQAQQAQYEKGRY